MKLLDLKQFELFRDDLKVKVLRHHAQHEDLWALRKGGGFQNYQNGQSWDVFGNAQHVVSFIAERDAFARFVGVWKVRGKRRTNNGYRYRTLELPGFDTLHGRLVVRWGAGTRSWAQWLHSRGNKDIVEILPPNYVMDFPGYYQFTLSYDQLATMVENPDSNREWKRMLSAVSGVYIVLDQQSGRQYVGSAYGAGGIWARWRNYAKSPSGGNVVLRQLLDRSPSRYKHFQFSVLRVLEPGSPKEDVIQQEKLTKRKLGTRAFGLNGN